MHPEGSLADLTLLSASSVDEMLPRTGEDPQEKQEEQQQEEKDQEEQGWWGAGKEKEESLVAVMDDTDMTRVKSRSFSDARQSSTEESHRCSLGTEPEPSTEQTSGTELLQSTRTCWSKRINTPQYLCILLNAARSLSLLQHMNNY